MKMLEFLKIEHIILELEAKDKFSAIQELVCIVCRDAASMDKEGICAGVLKREESISTAIGEGIAVPHAKCSNVSGVTIAFGRSKEGIDFGAPDGKPVDLIFLIVSPLKDAGTQLKILAMLARLLKDKGFADKLREAKDRNEIIALFAKADEALRL